MSMSFSKTLIRFGNSLPHLSRRPKPVSFLSLARRWWHGFTLRAGAGPCALRPAGRAAAGGPGPREAAAGAAGGAGAGQPRPAAPSAGAPLAAPPQEKKPSTKP